MLDLPRLSFSAISMFVNCPYRFFTNKVGPRENKEPFTGSGAMSYGDKVHKAVEAHVKTRQPLDVLLPDDTSAITNINSGLDYAKRAGFDTANAKAEDKIFLDRSAAAFTPDDNFDQRIWFQADADYLVFHTEDPSKALLIDWKTGKKFGDPYQDALNAWAIFAKYPGIQSLETKFIYFKTNDTMHELFERDTLMQHPKMQRFLKDLVALREALSTNTFAKRQSPLCRFCEVKACEFNNE